MRSGEASAARRTPSSPDSASITSKPENSRTALISFRFLGLSSTTRIGVPVHAPVPVIGALSVARGAGAGDPGRNATVVSAALRSSRLIGFTRYAAAPSATPRARSSTIETTMIGMSRVAGSALRASSTAQPSIPGKPDVEQDDVGAHPPHGVETGRPVPGLDDAGGHPGQVDGQQLQRRTVVLDHDHLAHEGRLGGLVASLGAVAFPPRDREAERAAHADLALEPHAATEQLDQALGEGEAEAGPLLARAAAPALLERLEDPLLVGLGHPDAAVGHGDVDVRAAPAGPDDHGTTRAGELHRVGHQVEHDLLEPEHVGVHDVDVVGDVEGEVDPLGGRPLAQHRRRVVENGPQVDRRVLQGHLPGLDLREVEDLVEELQQVATRAVDVVQVLLLPLVELAEHPLEEHLGEPEHRVQRRPELVGHAGEELGLVPARELQLEALLLEVPVEAGVEERKGGLARERLEQVEGLVGEVARPLAADDERPDDVALAQHRHRGQRAPAVVVEDLEVRVQRHGAQVRHGDRSAFPGGAPHEGLVHVDADRAQTLDDAGRRAVGAAHQEDSGPARRTP